MTCRKDGGKLIVRRTFVFLHTSGLISVRRANTHGKVMAMDMGTERKSTTTDTIPRNEAMHIPFLSAYTDHPKLQDSGRSDVRVQCPITLHPANRVSAIKVILRVGSALGYCPRSMFALYPGCCPI